MISLSKYFRSTIEIPDSFEMDRSCYRTRGEMQLACNLMDVAYDQIDACRLSENWTLKFMETSIFRIVRKYVQRFFTVFGRLHIGLKNVGRNVGVAECSDTSFCFIY